MITYQKGELNSRTFAQEYSCASMMEDETN
jgi:hypothetical protein